MLSPVRPTIRFVTTTGARDRQFRGVLGVREFRGLWFADVQSLLGDQIARVALSVLVFDRTRSGFWTAFVYALTYLPALIGSELGVLADRMPRRRLLVVGDLVRAVLIALMALPSAPLGVVVGLLVAVVVVGAPWKAAESALVADILGAKSYAVGVGLRVATVQGAQLIGFGIGGALVAAVGTRLALAMDAATFALSALLILGAVQKRPAAADRESNNRPRWGGGLRHVLGDRQLATLAGLAWLAGWYVVPEGLAAPYAAAFGRGPATVGLLLASAPAGVLVGSLVFVRRFDDEARSRWLSPMAVAAGVPLALCIGHLELWMVLIAWAASGACMAYQVQVIAEFVGAVPPNIRGQAIAVASAGLLAAQGIGLLLGGVVAQLSSAHVAVAAAGALGSITAVLLAIIRRRTRADLVPSLQVKTPEP